MDLLGEVLHDLRAIVARAEAAGVAPTQIVVDPGIGFGKTREQNLSAGRLGECARSAGRCCSARRASR